MGREIFLQPPGAILESTLNFDVHGPRADAKFLGNDASRNVFQQHRSKDRAAALRHLLHHTLQGTQLRASLGHPSGIWSLIGQIQQRVNFRSRHATCLSATPVGGDVQRNLVKVTERMTDRGEDRGFFEPQVGFLQRFVCGL